jgi:hypothetical protein
VKMGVIIMTMTRDEEGLGTYQAPHTF